MNVQVLEQQSFDFFVGSMDSGFEEVRREESVQDDVGEHGASQSVPPGESREVPKESRELPEESRDAAEEPQETMPEDAERSALLEEVTNDSMWIRQ